MTLQERLQRAKTGGTALYRGADRQPTYRGGSGGPTPATETAADGPLSLEERLGRAKVGELPGIREAHETGYQNWLKEVDRFTDQTRQDSTARDGVWQEPSAFRDYQEQSERTIRGLQQQAARYRDYFDSHRDLYDSEALTGVLETLDQGSKYLGGVGDTLRAEGEYRGQFLDRDEFDTYSRLTGADAEELKAWNQELGEEIDALKAQIPAYKDPVFGYSPAEQQKVDELHTAIARKEQTRNRVLARYYELDNEGKLAALEQDPTATGLYELADAKTGDADAMLRRMRDRLDHGGRPEEDPEALATIEQVYGLSPAKSGSTAQYMNDLTEAAGRDVGEIQALADMGYDYSRLARYKKTQEAAARYAKEQEALREWVRESPWNAALGSAGTVLAAPVQGVDWLDTVGHSLTGGSADDIEHYEPLNVYNMGATNFVSGVRGETADMIDEATPDVFGFNVPSFLYQTVMSMADSALQVHTLGSASLPFMGGAAAASEAQDIIARGGNNTQVLLGSAAAGAAEMLFEKFSVENLLTPKSVTGWKSLLKETAKQAGTEATEEMFTEIANILSDAAIMGRDSKSELAVREYMLQGKSEEEARQQLFFDQISQVVEAGAGGALSGGIMGGTTGAVNWALGGQYQGVEPMQYRDNANKPQSGLAAQSPVASGDTPFQKGAEGQVDPLVQAAREMVEEQSSVSAYGAATPFQKGALEQTQVDKAGQQRIEADRSGQQRTRAAMENASALVKASEVFGENGRKAFAAAWDGQTDSAQYYAGFAAWYQAGLTGKTQDQVRGPYTGAVNEAQQIAAYSSGQRDAAVSLAKEKAAAPYAKAAGDGAGLVYDTYVAEAVESEGWNPPGQTTVMDTESPSHGEAVTAPFNKGATGRQSRPYLTAHDAEQINDVAQALGVRVRFVDSVDGGRANAQLSGSEILVEKGNPNPVLFVVGHELTHRLQELAPEQYRAFRAAAVEDLADSAVQAKLDAYRAQGEEILYEGAMDEAAADYAGQLMEGGALLDDFIQRHRTDKTLLERLRDAFRQLVAKLTGREKRQAQTAEGKLSAALDAAVEQAGRLENAAQNGERESPRQPSAGPPPFNKGGTEPSATAPIGAGGEARYSLKEYDGKDLSRDGSIYTYDFLTSLPNMKVTSLPDVDAVRDSGGKVDTRAVVDLGMKNARAVGTERDGKIFIQNDYTGRDLRLDAASIRHGLNGGLNRLLTNARLGSVIGDVVKNAVPINALQDKAAGVTGTYAMAGYATDSAGREFVAIVTVEQRSGQVNGLEVYDVTHALSGRQKKSSQASTKLQGVYPIKAADITIADFLEAVKNTHQSILPQNVLDHFGETRNPKGDYTGDVKFSLKGATITKSYDQLLRENGALRERLDYWRGQTRRTKEATTDKKAVTAATNTMLEKYGAQMDAGELSGRLQALYDHMAGTRYGNREVENSDVWKGAEEIARDIAESAVSEWSLADEFPGLKEKLRTTPITLGHEYDSDIRKENFRREYRGKLKLSSQGPTNVDAVYAELAEAYPGLFPEDITHPADQMEQIMSVADSLHTVEEQGRFSGQMEEAVTGITNEIMEQFFDLPQTRATFADRKAYKLDEAVAHGKQRVQETREQYQARMQALRAENRQAVQRAIVRERETRERQVAELKNKYRAKTEAGRERQSAAELRRKITRHAKALSDKLLRPTDKAHIPEELRGPVAAVLEAINLESQYTVDPETGKRTKGGDGGPTKRTQAFLKLKAQYAEINKNGGDLVIDPALLGSDAEGVQGSLDAVIAMGDTRLADMNSAQLATVWQVLKAVEHSVGTAGKLLSQSKYQRTAEWADALDRDTGTRRDKRSLMKNHPTLDLENPYTFFSHFGEAGKAMYRTLRDAQDRQQVLTNQVAEAAVEVVGRESPRPSGPPPFDKGGTGGASPALQRNAEKRVKALETATHDFTTEGGQKLILSTAQVMELYELMKRKQAQEHLLVGGIVQPEIRGTKVRRGTDAIRLTLNDLANITGALTAEEKGIADGLQKLTVTVLADMGNEASMTAYGYRKFTEADYWPIRSAREGLHSNIEKGGDNARSIKNIGMAQATVPHANNQVDIGSIFDTFARHTGDMVDYAAWLVPMEDLNRVYNYQYRDGEGNPTGTTVKGLLERAGGAGAQKYWQDLMEDIQNGIKAKNDSPIGAIASKGIGAFKGAAVGGNIRVVIQQPTAFFRAGAVLNPADMALGLTKGATKGNGWGKALQYSPIAMRKDAGGFDISSPGTMKETLFGKTGAVDKLNDALSWGAGKADAVTWGRLWNACEWQVARTHKELTKGSGDFYAEVNRVFTDMVDQTQVVDGILQRANIMRSSNAMVQQATSFMGEPLMSLNLTMRAWDQLRGEQDPKKRGKAIRNLGRTATALMVTAAVNAVAQSLVDAMRDDDKDKKYWERFQSAFTGLTGEEETPFDKAWAAVMEGNLGGGLNPLDQIPYVKDVLSLMQGYDVSRTEMSVIQDLIEAGQTFTQSAGGQGKRTLPYAVKELFAAGSKLFGIPVANLTRDIWALLRSVAVETGNLPLQYEMEKAIYNVGSEKNKSRFSDIMYRALEAGEMETYQHIRDELMNEMGLDGVVLDNAMKSRYNARVQKDPSYSLSQRAQDLLGVRPGGKDGKEEEFGADDLDSEAFQAYTTQRSAQFRETVDSLEDMPSFRDMDQDTRDKLVEAAYTLAHQTALADNSDGQYSPSYKWVRDALDAQEEAGIDAGEFLLWHTAYNMALTDKDASGKAIKGREKSDKVRAWLNEQDMTDAQKAYLWGTEYKSEW